MSAPEEFRIPIENRLLAALPDEDHERLLPHLEEVHLPKGKVLYEVGDTARHAYFLTNGMVSLLSTTEDGETMEVGMVGSEGMIGVPIIMRVGTTPYRVKVQITADALRVSAQAVENEFDRCGAWQDVLLRYTHALHAQVVQSAVCNQFHAVEERLARWLLLTRDRVGSDTIELTHESISHMLGASRAGVSLAAGAIQKRGLIRYARGRITILDRTGLITVSCECYRIIEEALENFLAA